MQHTIERFRHAILTRDTSLLQQLLADDLSYGHSDGHVEGKYEFISKIGSGAYSFVTMELSKQSIRETGNIAIVRHELDAQTNDEGNRGEAHLYVLLIWRQEADGWKLLARQAVKK